jgi:HAMP domain-containing protein
MFSRLKLAPKFTLLMLLVFVVGSAIGGLVLAKALQQRVEAQVTSEGVMLMQSMLAVSGYTDQEVRPLLEAYETPEVFWPQMIPAYSSRRVFQLLQAAGEHRGNFDYVYKAAVLNPTNPEDQADDFETSLVSNFRNTPSLQEASGYRELPNQGVMFYSAQPISIRDPSCLECHSTPEVAPSAMLAQYGRENGFNWALNEVLGTQIVYIPAEAIFQAAKRAFTSVMVLFTAFFAIALLCLNTLLKPLVVQPVQSLAKLSEKLANDDIQHPDDLDPAESRKLSKVMGRQDELGQLGQVFQKMVNQVIARQQRLRQQIRDLKIEIDESRKSQEVQEIVETDYFRNLQEKANKFRKRNTEENAND